MEALITIKPFDLDNISILSHSSTIPTTNKQFQVDNEVSKKLSSYHKKNMGTISFDTIHKIKPEFDGLLPNFETLNLIKKIATSTAVSVNNGHPELEITKEEFAKVLDLEISKIVSEFKHILKKKEETIKDQANEIRILKIKQTLYEEVLNQANSNYEVENKVL